MTLLFEPSSPARRPHYLVFHRRAVLAGAFLAGRQKLFVDLQELLLEAGRSTTARTGI
ncbi:hypothetical protein [Natrarchaeobaculum sulfurireducens]|uniref:hypothetical protein n=1 Tax=Natrarchaeobaculum sulfurireducens TaxID=2044521 RepID=UPI0012B63C50|nr:hypothetical protein [Natrarchaeobaculum sulfurireducens]